MKKYSLKNVLQWTDKNCIQIFCHKFVKINEATAQERDGEKTEGYEKQAVKIPGKVESKQNHHRNEDKTGNSIREHGDLWVQKGTHDIN